MNESKSRLKSTVMNIKVYVDNLTAVTTEGDLKGLFSAYGNVVDVNIAVDHASHKPRGFGFVTMTTSKGARAAIQALNGKDIGTCTLTVSEAWPREALASSPNGQRNPPTGPAVSSQPPLQNES
jgi:cold-inducible RNA-binding protein